MPGEVKTIEFTLNRQHLSFIGQDNKRIVEPGDFVVSIGNSSLNFSLK
ncbi:MAG TPA: fibronectin type III-like domain-contianing protein [Ignavibacteriaceae bacterium]